MALKAVTLVVAAWCCTAVSAAAQRGAFPWKAGDRPPALGGVRLGDRRVHVDSLLGAPSSVDTLDNGVVLFRYTRGFIVAYSPGDSVEVVYLAQTGAAVGNVKVGQTMDDVRARWGSPSATEGAVSMYIARDWAVMVLADTTGKRVLQLGLAGTVGPAEPYVVPDSTDVFKVAAGTWDWSGADGFCRDDPHTITFSPDRKFMILTFANPDTADDGTVKRDFRYEIRGHTRNSIRGFIQGETRRTDGGELVVWDLVLMSPDVYRWHRTDWEEGGLTKPVLRCR